MALSLEAIEASDFCCFTRGNWNDIVVSGVGVLASPRPIGQLFVFSAAWGVVPGNLQVNVKFVLKPTWRWEKFENGYPYFFKRTTVPIL